ncbi:MAG TPA: methyltransferase domain-containing protein, partial [Thermodesulfobacteriaceae bacterium]|nr:methyltransferase domain-containing protein [Thermodesulfobacteriaceae bacterium]
SQIFSHPGTRFDLGSGAWDSLAIGPDGSVFPTPATVDFEGLCAGSVSEGLGKVWRSSPVLEDIRRLSLLDSEKMAEDPFRFIIGGGDVDHAARLSSDGSVILAADPYSPLYKDMALMLIENEVKSLPVLREPGIMLRMGDLVTGCRADAEVNFTHCNCLLSMGGESGHSLVRDFYAERAEDPDKNILNPVQFDRADLDFIPEEAKVRMYGCGSPVRDAGIAPGEVVLDLGCGTGVECFLAARATGAGGRVMGLDMTDQMLAIARRAAVKVEAALGFGNVSFIKGRLEDIPLEDGLVDVVISNCVLNLSENKRLVFAEIFRILRPGGRLVVSDVVTEEELPLTMRTDQRLTGECLGGAFRQGYLFSMIRAAGFVDSRVIKRFPYRQVREYRFFSLTFSACKPVRKEDDAVNRAMYGGPFRAVVTDDGSVFTRGLSRPLSRGPGTSSESLAASGMFLLDSDDGSVTNVEYESGCSCISMPGGAKQEEVRGTVRETGCLICGVPVEYLPGLEERQCAMCGETKAADAECRNGHFVCDSCHIKDPLALIRKICLESRETDMIRLLDAIHSHPQIPMHGPEHHAIVPGVILAAYRNTGGVLSDHDILAGIDRGAQVPGGACAFLAVCGAVLGAGAAFSVILKATPLTPGKRQDVQQAVAGIMSDISKLKAARCCQRECYMVLKGVAAVSEKLISVRLRAHHRLECVQYGLNRECIRYGCPLYPGKKKNDRDSLKSIMDTLQTGSSPVVVSEADNLEK